MRTAEMLRLSWRAWLSHSPVRVGPWWIGHAWTVVFCAVVALGFTAVSMLVNGQGGDWRSLPDWWLWYRANLIVSLTIGFSVRIAFAASELAIGRDRIARAGPWQRTLYFLVVPSIGVAVGWPLGVQWAMGVDVRQLFSLDHPRLFAGSVLLAVLITAVFHQFFLAKSRQIRAENTAAEAQLRLLQAQIEPHFLFNTLANVTALMEADTPRAKAMLESFVDYLRASLSGLGTGTHTLGAELALVEAYLRIVKIRMEDRLAYRIDVPAELRACPLPALSLQPLVENAIVHGLEPRIEGGSVGISARLDGRTLVLAVDDDGAGLAAGSAATTPARAGSGTALANIRRRLAQAHGGGARLSVEPAVPRGVRARLSLPAPALAAP